MRAAPCDGADLGELAASRDRAGKARTYTVVVGPITSDAAESVRRSDFTRMSAAVVAVPGLAAFVGGERGDEQAHGGVEPPQAE